MVVLATFDRAASQNFLSLSRIRAMEAPFEIRFGYLEKNRQNQKEKNFINSSYSLKIPKISRQFFNGPE